MKKQFMSNHSELFGYLEAGAKLYWKPDTRKEKLYLFLNSDKNIEVANDHPLFDGLLNVPASDFYLNLGK